MGHWIDIRPVSWPLGIDKSMILIMRRHLNLLPKWLLYGLSWHLLRHKGGLSDKWTWKMLFYMGIWRKKSMSPPPGMFATPFLEVCRLRQSLYGLKQASHVWFDKFRSTLLGFHFTQSQFDSSLFLCKTSVGIVLLLVYVDDIVIIGSDAALLTQSPSQGLFSHERSWSLAVLSWPWGAAYSDWYIVTPTQIHRGSNFISWPLIG
jgi:hypothetical protein